MSTSEVSERVTGPFVSSESDVTSPDSVNKNINNLREYFKKFQAQTMRDKMKKVPKNAPVGV